MIQPATLPTAAKLLLAIGGQAASGDGAAFDTQFSALLAASYAIAPEVALGEAGGAPRQEMLFKPELRPAGGKHSGKAGGKLLPDSPILASFTSLL